MSNFPGEMKKRIFSLGDIISFASANQIRVMCHLFHNDSFVTNFLFTLPIGVISILIGIKSWIDLIVSNSRDSPEDQMMSR